MISEEVGAWTDRSVAGRDRNSPGAQPLAPPHQGAAAVLATSQLSTIVFIDDSAHGATAGLVLPQVAINATCPPHGADCMHYSPLAPSSPRRLAGSFAAAQRFDHGSRGWTRFMFSHLQIWLACFRPIPFPLLCALDRVYRSRLAQAMASA